VFGYGQGQNVKSAGTVDSYVLEGLRGGLTYMAFFLAGHFALRHWTIGSRWAYAGIGAVACAGAVAIQMPAWAWASQIQHGTISLLGGFVALMGAVIGFLYHWRSGYEARGDDPAALARALATPGQEGRFDGISPTISDDRALVNTGAAEYFDGPLQVRTSVPIMFVAALLSAGLYGLGLFIIRVGGQMVDQARAAMPLDQSLSLAVNAHLLTIVISGTFAPLPFAVVVFLGHMLAKSLDKQSYLAYAVIGLLLPVLVSVLAGVTGVIYGVQCIFPLAIAMCVYRNMAGLEPKPVKEDILLNDRRNLVGADHARRQFGRLVKS